MQRSKKCKKSKNTKRPKHAKNTKRAKTNNIKMHLRASYQNLLLHTCYNFGNSSLQFTSLKVRLSDWYSEYFSAQFSRDKKFPGFQLAPWYGDMGQLQLGPVVSTQVMSKSPARIVEGGFCLMWIQVNTQSRGQVNTSGYM